MLRYLQVRNRAQKEVTVKIITATKQEHLLWEDSVLSILPEFSSSSLTVTL